MIRITGGELKNRKLSGPRQQGIRPTLARVRESLFDALAARGAEGEFLDLYAGSGLIGIEALSRGFTRAVFVDKSQRACNLIRRNLELLDVDKRAVVIHEDALAALTIFEQEQTQFSVYFADPPYEAGLAAKTLNKLDECSFRTDSLIVIQHSRREQLAAQRLQLLKQLHAGDTMLSLFAATKGGSYC